MRSEVKVKKKKEETRKRSTLNKKGQTTLLKEENEKVKKSVKIEKNTLKKWLTKTSITYFGLFILDVIVVIYLARMNIVNYVKILDEEIFVSKTSYLLLGRNYINLFFSAFFYSYICLVNKFFLHKKNTKNFLFRLLVILLVLNIVLFFLFTKRVY